MIAIFLVDGKVFAIDEHCPHAGGPLGAGHLTGDVVMCPWHGWRFRVTDGVWVDAPNRERRSLATTSPGKETIFGSTSLGDAPPESGRELGGL